jgi:hypothetical protein
LVPVIVKCEIVHKKNREKQKGVDEERHPRVVLIVVFIYTTTLIYANTKVPTSKQTPSHPTSRETSSQQKSQQSKQSKQPKKKKTKKHKMFPALVKTFRRRNRRHVEQATTRMDASTRTHLVEYVQDGMGGTPDDIRQELTVLQTELDLAKDQVAQLANKQDFIATRLQTYQRLVATAATLPKEEVVVVVVASATEAPAVVADATFTTSTSTSSSSNAGATTNNNSTSSSTEKEPQAVQRTVTLSPKLLEQLKMIEQLNQDMIHQIKAQRQRIRELEKEQDLLHLQTDECQDFLDAAQKAERQHHPAVVVGDRETTNNNDDQKDQERNSDKPSLESQEDDQPLEKQQPPPPPDGTSADEIVGEDANRDNHDDKELQQEEDLELGAISTGTVTTTTTTTRTTLSPPRSATLSTSTAVVVDSPQDDDEDDNTIDIGSGAGEHDIETNETKD